MLCTSRNIPIANYVYVADTCSMAGCSTHGTSRRECSPVILGPKPKNISNQKPESAIASCGNNQRCPTAVPPFRANDEFLSSSRLLKQAIESKAGFPFTLIDPITYSTPHQQSSWTTTDHPVLEKNQNLGFLLLGNCFRKTESAVYLDHLLPTSPSQPLPPTPTDLPTVATRSTSRNTTPSPPASTDHLFYPDNNRQPLNPSHKQTATFPAMSDPAIFNAMIQPHGSDPFRGGQQHEFVNEDRHLPTYDMPATPPPPIASVDIDGAVLRRFFEFFKDVSGQRHDFEARMHEFWQELSLHCLTNGYPEAAVQPWIDMQMSLIRAILKEMGQVGINFGLLGENTVGGGVANGPAVVVNALPIPDADIIREFMDALQDGASVFDMPDTAPLKHWHNDMKPDALERIAHQFLDGFKRLHGGHDENHTAHGYSFKMRYDTVVEVLRKCKGSVYRMSRPSTLDDILVNPRKMRQRFIDNQINNAKKKKDAKELNRLRSVLIEIQGREEESEHAQDGSPLAASSDDEADEPRPTKRKRSKGKAKETVAACRAYSVASSAAAGPLDMAHDDSAYFDMPPPVGGVNKALLNAGAGDILLGHTGYEDYRHGMQQGLVDNYRLPQDETGELDEFWQQLEFDA
ncbi:hypothetical protein FN846DRAFT_1024506 [Sphaerosporella brunnea]|uniref:Uncharacterized protein n=1 Tax=Sphaerosporella brunnea TaxID=1250544 RepID=A0A5J5EIA4_9PEZI|nr:hypothetical protein FN846DRAFT_1024506 [Sphaerosporella brunnea]